MPSEPMLFVSHKHSDREIAETIARFIRNSSAGKVRVHLSSSPHFEGPRLGQPINSELKNALAITEVVILVFTTDTEDWSYCMWECGVATNPREERPTSVVVVQCTDDSPKPYGDQLRVDARDLDSVHMFVKSLLTTTDLLPESGRTHHRLLTRWPRGKRLRRGSPRGSRHACCPLAASPERALRPPRSSASSLPTRAAHEVRTSYLAGETDECLRILESEAHVVAAALGAENLLGMVLSPGTTLGDVLASWRSDHGTDVEPRWWWTLAEQMEAALAGKMRPVSGRRSALCSGERTCRTSRPPGRSPPGVEFDVYLVPFAPRPIPVKDKMITLGQMYLKDEAVDPLEQLLLMDLIREMATRRATRLPILDHGRPRAIVHRSTINDFLVQAMASGNETVSLSLQDLLDRLGDAAAETPMPTCPLRQRSKKR